MQKLPESLEDTETVFPWFLAAQVFELLKEKEVNIVRYCDLDTRNSWCGSQFRYLDEYVKFRTGSKSPFAFIKGLFSYGSIRLWGDRFPALKQSVINCSKSLKKPTVIVQHDADLLPDKTIAMMGLEAEYNICSSNYFFVKQAQEEIYELNIGELLEKEKQGFEIGYHQNAYERSGYDYRRAFFIVDDDVKWLKQYFNIRSFVPHGGIPSIDGLNNEYLPHKHALKSLLWAFNGDCILKDYTWSDGGIKKRYPCDPRVFVKELVNGSRAMMLMHPQYYGTVLRSDWRNLPIADQKWWRQLWGL